MRSKPPPTTLIYFTQSGPNRPRFYVPTSCYVHTHTNHLQLSSPCQSLTDVVRSCPARAHGTLSHSRVGLAKIDCWPAICTVKYSCHAHHRVCTFLRPATCMLKKKHLGSLFAQGSHDLRCSLSSEGYAALKFLWLSLTPEPKLGRNRLSQV